MILEYPHYTQYARLTVDIAMTKWFLQNQNVWLSFCQMRNIYSVLGKLSIVNVRRENVKGTCSITQHQAFLWLALHLVWQCIPFSIITLSRQEWITLCNTHFKHRYTESVIALYASPSCHLVLNTTIRFTFTFLHLVATCTKLNTDFLCTLCFPWEFHTKPLYI